MGKPQGELVLDFLGRFTGPWPNVDDLLPLLAEDCSYQLLASQSEPIVGRSAFRDEMLRQQKANPSVRAEVKNITSSDTHVIIERVDHNTTLGKERSLPIVGVFRINEDNQIAEYRDYFDTGYIARELAITPEQLRALMV
jgi:ketosteroid isomerase-like protein